MVTLSLRGARREAAGDGDGVLDRHVGHVRVLAREGDLAEHEERPVGLDLDRDARVADVARPQSRGDGAAQLRRGQAARFDRADQRQAHRALGIDGVVVGQRVLAEHHDAQFVAAVERVGAVLECRGDRHDLRHAAHRIGRRLRRAIHPRVELGDRATGAAA